VGDGVSEVPGSGALSGGGGTEVAERGEKLSEGIRARGEGGSVGAVLRCSLNVVLAAMLLLSIGCTDAPASDAGLPVDDLGPELAGPVALIPTSPEVAAVCASEVTSTACTTRDAAALVARCRARLSARGIPCATTADCLATYRPSRPVACRAGATYPDRASCAEAVEDDCAFYRACLDAAHPCGVDGYALAFGERLCNAFIARREEFSPAGQAWLRGVRTCLQRSLVPLVGAGALSCEALVDAAYASHSGCYTAPGNSVCNLPPADLGALTRVLAPWLRDPRALRQIGEVLRSCSDAGAH